MPLWTSMTPAGRKYAQVNSSSRVHTTFTGRPAARASRAASMAASLVCFPPYAEPVSGTITRTSLSDKWKISASASRLANGRCVPVHPVRRAGQSLFHGTSLLPETVIGLRSSVLLEIRKDLLVRDLWHFLPLRVNRIESTLRLIGAWRRCAHKLAITHYENARHGLRRAVIVSRERRTK